MQDHAGQFFYKAKGLLLPCDILYQSRLHLKMTAIWIPACIIHLLLASAGNGTTASQVDVKAYNLGESPLSSETTVPIYLRHNATPSAEIGLGFTDEFYSIEVSENATALQLIKTLAVENGNVPNRTVSIRCHIIEGNNEGLFYTNTSDRNCEVRLKVGKLDHETSKVYQLKVKLCAVPDFVDSQRSVTTVEIHITDENDNKPEFVFPSVRYKMPTPNVYYGAITRDSILGSQVLTVKAEDRDSGKFGAVTYEIVPSDRGSEYFAIGSATGVIRTAKLFGDVDKNRFPMAFKVLARDNYFSSCCSNTNEAKVVVNLIELDDRLILVLEGIKRDVVKESKNEIEEILQERTGLILGVDKFTPKQFLNENQTLQSDDSATDVWFHVIDPETETILDINQTKLKRSILDSNALSNITFGIFRNIQVNASTIHAPYVAMKPATGVAATTSGVSPYTVKFILPFLTIVLVTASIILTCQLFERFRRQNHITYNGTEGRNNSIYIETTVKEHDPEISCSYLRMPFIPPIDRGDSSSSDSTGTTTLTTTLSISGSITQEVTTEL